MNNYIISIKQTGKDRVGYFAGVDDEISSTVPAVVWSGNSFQTRRVDTEALVFTEIKSNAKILRGKTNMKSYLYRILEQLPYLPIEISEIKIELLSEVEG